MAKKQTFGADAAKLKQAHRKMAKVIIPFTNEKGKVNYKTAIVEQDSVSEYIRTAKA
jgi:hypothetical protein